MATKPATLRDRFRRELAILEGGQQGEILTVLQQVAMMLQAPEVENAPFFFHDKKTPSRPETP